MRYTAKPADKVSADFGRNPGAGLEYPGTSLGLARILAHGFVARLANIDILAATRFAP
jgi:hypothetical protein